MPDDSARVRRKLTGVLFSGVGLTSTGFIAAITVAGLAAEDLTGTSSLAGVPAAASTIGTALGSMILASATVRLGRRPMLIGAYLVAGSASALAALAACATEKPFAPQDSRVLVGQAMPDAFGTKQAFPGGTTPITSGTA